MADYSICKCIRNDKPLKRNGKYPVYLRVRVGTRNTKIPTGLEVWNGRWDAKRMEPKDKPLAIQLNRKIMELDLYINRLLADGTELTMDLVKGFYAGKRRLKPEHGSFYDYYLDFVERKRKEGLNPETIRVYMTTFHVLKEFKPEFRISDISLTLIEDVHVVAFIRFYRFNAGDIGTRRQSKLFGNLLRIAIRPRIIDN